MLDDIPALSIPEGVPALLRDLIHDRLGIHFEADRFELMLEKLRDRAIFHGCRSYLDYYFILKYEEKGVGEWLRVMDAFSVQETYFWREFSQIESLIQFVVPAWFKTHAAPLRIWSAACASGEEPYTIVMALHEAGLGHLPIEVFASDASEAALTRARAGVYRERSFRALPEALRQKYFTAVPEGWKLNPAIARRVRFERANLVNPGEIAQLATVPVIFCRNVFIYFSADSIRRTVDMFAQRMTGHGHLFVGSSESLLKLTQEFLLEEMGDAFVYVRKPRSVSAHP
ncbi:MAG TPA: protein-glutamate O-methyltransferase CheR [Opitutaceae bacterium]|nr:protein-glutamate O-methyltransferase CheR [Opitutaceae bacterium]